MIKSEYHSRENKLFSQRYALAEKLIAIKKNIESRCVQHRSKQLKVHLRSNERYRHAQCRYCGELIAFQKFEEYVIENEDTVLPFWKRDHKVKTFWVAWDIDPVDYGPISKHDCGRRVLK